MTEKNIRLHFPASKPKPSMVLTPEETALIQHLREQQMAPPTAIELESMKEDREKLWAERLARAKRLLSTEPTPPPTPEPEKMHPAHIMRPPPEPEPPKGMHPAIILCPPDYDLNNQEGYDPAIHGPLHSEG